MKRTCLIVLFGAIFCSMVFITVRASIVRNVFDNSALMADPWFQATLADAYFGFLTFYVWVAWKEPTILRRVAWFFLIMTLGNLAMSAYVLIRLIQLKVGGLHQLLTEPGTEG